MRPKLFVVGCVWWNLREVSMTVSQGFGALPPSPEKEKLVWVSSWLEGALKEEGCMRVFLTVGGLCEKIFSFVDSAPSKLQPVPPMAVVKDNTMIPPTPLASWGKLEKAGVTLYGTSEKRILVDASTSFVLSLGVRNSLGYVCQGDVLGAIEKSTYKVRRAVVVCVG
jgi:hypothetical protein